MKPPSFGRETSALVGDSTMIRPHVGRPVNRLSITFQPST
jgi:hypothetical protein